MRVGISSSLIYSEIIQILNINIQEIIQDQ